MRVVERLLNTDNVVKTKPDRLSTLTEDVMEDIFVQMERRPRKSLKQLSLQTGFIFY